MFRAYFQEQSTGQWKPVDADAYDLSVHGTNLRCGDPACKAEMIFVSCRTSHAGLATRASHFRSKDPNQHRLDCDAYRPSRDVDSLSIPLPDANAQGYPVVINFNFNLGDPNYKSESDRTAHHIDNPYNCFREANKKAYARDSIKSIGEYFKFFSKIKMKYPDSLDKLHVAHCGQIIPHEDFSVGEDLGRLKKLTKSVYGAARGKGIESGQRFDFARHIVFTPSRKMRESLGNLNSTVQGTSHVLKTHYGHPLILQHHLHFPEHDILRSSVTHEKMHVLATPACDVGLWRLRMHEFNNLAKTAKKKAVFLPLDWMVQTSDQCQPVDGAAVLEY